MFGILPSLVFGSPVGIGKPSRKNPQYPRHGSVCNNAAGCETPRRVNLYGYPGDALVAIVAVLTQQSREIAEVDVTISALWLDITLFGSRAGGNPIVRQELGEV